MCCRGCPNEARPSPQLSRFEYAHCLREAGKGHNPSGYFCVFLVEFGTAFLFWFFEGWRTSRRRRVEYDLTCTCRRKWRWRSGGRLRPTSARSPRCGHRARALRTRGAITLFLAKTATGKPNATSPLISLDLSRAMPLLTRLVLPDVLLVFCSYNMGRLPNACKSFA